MSEALAAAGIEVTSVVEEGPVVEGGSTRSVGFVVAPEDGPAAVRVLHEVLFAPNPRPGPAEGAAAPRGEADGIHA